MPFKMAANINHPTLLKNQSAIKYHKIICMCSVNFGISKIPTHCLKEALVTCPVTAGGL